MVAEGWKRMGIARSTDSEVCHGKDVRTKHVHSRYHVKKSDRDVFHAVFAMLLLK